MYKTFVRKRIKQEAWGNLSGNWLKSFVILAIQSVLTMRILRFLPIRIPPIEKVLEVNGNLPYLAKLFFPNGFTEKTLVSIAVTAALYILVLAPLSIGICRFFLNVAKGEKAKFSDVFGVYTSLKTVFSSVWLSILISLLSIFWIALFSLILVAFIFGALLLESVYLLYIAELLSPVVGLFSVFWVSRYEFAKYILAEGKSGGALSSLRKCMSLLKNRSGECVILRATYFLWDMISVYTPIRFVYLAVFGTVYAKYLYYMRGNVRIDEEQNAPHQ